jgi:restriction endonuclease S subunit
VRSILAWTIFIDCIKPGLKTLSIVKPGKILTIGFFRNTLPSNLTPFFQTLRRHSENENNEIFSVDTTTFGKLESMILANAQLPHPPPMKTLKFIAPKVTHEPKNYDKDSIPPGIDSLVKKAR